MMNIDTNHTHHLRIQEVYSRKQLTVRYVRCNHNLLQQVDQSKLLNQSY